MNRPFEVLYLEIEKIILLALILFLKSQIMFYVIKLKQLEAFGVKLGRAIAMK